MVLKNLTVIAGITTAFVLSMCHASHASVRHHRHHYRHHQFERAVGVLDHSSAAVRVARKRLRAGRRLTQTDANGNPLYAKVHTALGLTATVIASARDKFQNFIEAVEIDHIEPETGIFTRGHRITDLGCLSSGHMPGSKHHWGGACDFMQKARNRTVAFMYHVTAIAQKFGLVDGCTWARVRGEYFTGPDCGHIEVPGSNVARRNSLYRMAER